MSKIDPNKKAAVESPLDAFQNQPKDFGLPKSDLEAGLNDFFHAFSGIIKPDVNDGALSSSGIYVPTGQLSLRIGKTTGKEYQQKFEAVELPPRAIDVATEFPSGTEELQDTITETRIFYEDYMNLYEGRRMNMIAALKSGNLSAQDAVIVKQMIKKLDEAIEFTKEQIASLDKLEEGIKIMDA